MSDIEKMSVYQKISHNIHDHDQICSNFLYCNEKERERKNIGLCKRFPNGYNPFLMRVLLEHFNLEIVSLENRLGSNKNTILIQEGNTTCDLLSSQETKKFSGAISLNLINLLKRWMTGTSKENEKISLTQGELIIMEKVEETVRKASMRQDSLIRAVLSTIKKYLVSRKRNEKKYRSTNSNYYKKSTEVYMSILSDWLPNEDLSQSAGELCSIWNYKSGPTEGWFNTLTFNRTNLTIPLKILELLNDPKEPIVELYISSKINSCIEDIFMDGGETIATVDTVMHRLNPRNIQRVKESKVKQNRIKFPLTKWQFQKAIKLTIAKLEGLLHTPYKSLN